MAAFPRSTARFVLGLLVALGLLACSFPYMLVAALRDPTVTPTITNTGTVTDTPPPSPTFSATPSLSPTPEATFGAATATETPSASAPAPVVTLYTPIAALGAPNMLNPLTVSSKMRPYYQWSPVANATLYTIWVWILDKDGNKKDLVIYEQHQASHICGDAMCMIRPEYQLTDGKRYTWVVQAYGLPGYGPFSSQITFAANKLTPTPGGSTPLCPLSVAGKYGGNRVLAVAFKTGAGHTATIVAEGNTISVFDELDFSHLKKSFTLSANINDLVVSGDYIFAATGSKGLRVINIQLSYSTSGEITNVSLAEVGYENSLSTSANDIELFTSGGVNYAIVADGANGVRLYDIQDPQNPTHKLTHSISGGSANGLYLTSNRVFVAFGAKGVYRLSLESIPGSFSSTTYPIKYDNTNIKSANSVTFEDPNIWVADGSAGVKRIDESVLYTSEVSSTPTPCSGCTVDTGITATDIVLNNSNIYAIGTSILKRYTIALPINTFDYPGFLHDANSLFIDPISSRMFVSDGSYGLRVFSINGTNDPVSPPVAVYDPSLVAYDVVIRTINNLPVAYVADYNGRIVKLNVSTPDSPSIMDSYDTSSGNPYALDVDNSSNYAYVALNDGGVDRINLTPPATIDNCSTTGYAKNIWNTNSTIYVAANDKGVGLCSGFPGSASYTSTDGLATSIFGYKNRLFVAAYQGGLAAFNIISGGGLSPYWAQNFLHTSGTNTRDVAIFGNYAYLALDTSGLEVVNVASATPVHKGALDTAGSVYNIFRFANNEEDYLALADYGSGVNIVDINEPEKPVSLCTLDTPGNARAVYYYNRHIYVADENNGLVILKMP